MKNKKIVYVLIPVTLIVWGLIFYKIFSGIYGGADVPVAGGNEFIAGDSNETMNDTFSIHPDYRDPFLGKFTKPAIIQDHRSDAVAKKVTATPVMSVWPSIVYGGLIRNQKSNKQLIMLVVNGQSTTAKTGDLVSGVEITKVYKDSIEVKFGKEKRFVRK